MMKNILVISENKSKWKYKFAFNVITPGPNLPPLQKGGSGGIYYGRFEIPLNPPLQRGT